MAAAQAVENQGSAVARERQRVAVQDGRGSVTGSRARHRQGLSEGWGGEEMK